MQKVSVEYLMLFSYKADLGTTLKCAAVKFRLCRQLAIQVYHSLKISVIALPFAPVCRTFCHLYTHTESLGFLVWGFIYFLCLL